MSLKDWALNAERKPTRKCETCSKYPHLVAEIAEVIKMQVEGTISLSRSSIYDKLAEDYGYSLSPTSFERHINNCVLPQIKGEK
jgi:hypothetical protein